jgi:hypothetical protein
LAINVWSTSILSLAYFFCAFAFFDFSNVSISVPEAVPLVWVALAAVLLIGAVGS